MQRHATSRATSPTTNCAGALLVALAVAIIAALATPTDAAPAAATATPTTAPSTATATAATTAKTGQPDQPDQPTPPDPETLERAIAFTRFYEQHAPVIPPLSPPSPPSPPDTRGAFIPDATVNVGRGNVPLYIPAAYDPADETPTPLIVLLHGYQNNGDEINAYFQFSPFVDSYNFILATPTGRRNFLNQEYWNATDACCDLFNNNPDDSAYLRALVDEIRAQYNIDPRRIHFAGHSNGGFMSYRMACDHADIVASVASLAGATWANPNNCTPSEPVSILQIHGTSDAVIAYNGGNVILGGFQPGAVFTAESWATYNVCDLTPTPPTSGPSQLDLTTNFAGPDTNPEEYITNCDVGGSARLWTIPGGPHSPGLTTGFTTAVLDFLFAHPKPPPPPLPPCPCDRNGDQTQAVDDYFAYLTEFFSQFNGPGTADLDGDGEVTISDYFEFLNCLPAIAASEACPGV